MLAGGRLIYCPDCRPASPFATYAMWQPEDTPKTVYRIELNKTLGCGGGYCGFAFFTPCGTALPLAERDFERGGVTIGGAFNCSMLPAQPRSPPTRTCADGDGAAL
eukprot:SAG22_NODE_16882_length_315_cov_1.203704_1_plen_105_part_11